MPLHVEIQNADGYDRQLIQKLLDLTQSTKDKTKYISNNEILESIISSIKTIGTMTVTSSGNKDTIDLILSPYKHEGKNVSVDIYGNFKDPEYGVSVIELRPERDEINLNRLPSEVSVCKRNHEYAILRFSSGKTHSSMPLDIMINVFYKPRVAEKTNSKPAEIKIDTAA